MNEFTKKIAHLILSKDLTGDEPVEPVEVLDALILEARNIVEKYADKV